MAKYNHQKIERKWQEVWERTGLYKTDIRKDENKFYSLVMFPYPSGNLHIGHWYNFSPADTYSRFMRMQGKNVLNPIGFDAFGLPAENAAIKRGVNPRVWTYDNIDKMITQLKTMGPSYDWSRVVITSDPEYYRWTQWMFLLMYKQGLAYKKKAVANWCPSCNTVLANEQVVGGRCERCETEVVQKEIDQWLFKITAYADRLLADLDDLDWPEKTKIMQRNWIGKSEGALVKFQIANCKLQSSSKPQIEKRGDSGRQKVNDEIIEVFTTCPDTIFGATYLVLAPEHELVARLLDVKGKKNVKTKEIKSYLEEAKKKTELERISEGGREKSGIFTGVNAINPATGAEIPIWISDYVLASYGTGAIMAVPAHDERDFAFAKKFNLPITQVIMPCVQDQANPPKESLEEVVRDTVIVHLRDKSTGKYALLNWHGSLEGITTAIMGGIEPGQTPEEAALAEIKEEAALDHVKIVKQLRWVTAAKYCASHKNQNRKAIAYGLLAEVDDLLKQTEIAEKERKLHTLVWADKKDILNRLTPTHQKIVWQQLNSETALEVEGELINSGKFNGFDTNTAKEMITEKYGLKYTNYKLRDWIISRQRYWGAPIPIVYCDKCGEIPVPENELPVILPEVKKFEPTGESPLKLDEQFISSNCPKCGGPARRETDTLDTFVCSSWYYFRYLDPQNNQAFADKKLIKGWLPVDMYIGGAEHSVLHLLYSRFFTKVLCDAGYIDFGEPFNSLRHQGTILGPDNQKMSKSRGNVIDPDDLVEKYGADSIRMFLEFMGPYDLGGPWQAGGIGGIQRFLQKIWDLAQVTVLVETNDPAISRQEAKTVKKVTKDLWELHFNTAIAALMSYLNFLQKQPAISKKTLENFTLLLAPFAPHLTEEIWREVLGYEESIHIQSWPGFDSSLIEDLIVSVAVQINGKIRGQILASPEASETEILNAAKQNPQISRYLGEAPKKIVYVKGRILSIVI